MYKLSALIYLFQTAMGDLVDGYVLRLLTAQTAELSVFTFTLQHVGSKTYWKLRVYVEDESNGCMTQFLQLINFNEIPFQNISVGLSTNIKWCESHSIKIVFF